nr:hypothetical protein 5 [bacterium]
MLALLGLIKFEFDGTLNGFSADRKYSYAEHDSLGYKPYIEFTGESLVDVDISLTLRKDFCNPELQLAALIACAKTRFRMPLVFGNGFFRGFYVIESLKETLVRTDKNGNMVEVNLDVSLKEVSLVQIKDEVLSMLGAGVSLISSFL